MAISDEQLEHDFMTYFSRIRTCLRRHQVEIRDAPTEVKASAEN